jgi:hypothetical protein
MHENKPAKSYLKTSWAVQLDYRMDGKKNGGKDGSRASLHKWMNISTFQNKRFINRIFRGWNRREQSVFRQSFNAWIEKHKS